MRDSIREGSESILVDVIVTPNSRRELILYEGIKSRIKVRVRANADRGKANKSVVKLFSNIFGDCSIILGQYSKKKTLLIESKENKLDEVIKKIKEVGNT